MKVENMINARGNTIPNQFIIYDDSLNITFQSYKSKIATYNSVHNTLNVHSHWDYSKTTLKYFKQFINEETSFSYENKQQWIKEMKNNPNIEEVV